MEELSRRIVSLMVVFFFSFLLAFSTCTKTSDGIIFDDKITTIFPPPSSSFPQGFSLENDSRTLPELVCHKNDGYECVRCQGVCVMNIYKQEGMVIHIEGGCQKPKKNKSLTNKCSLDFGHDSHVMKNIFDGKSTDFGGIILSKNVKVYKKCCFTSRCNSPKKFMNELVGMRHKRRRGDSEFASTDARVTTFFFFGLAAIVIVSTIGWTVRVTMKGDKESPDYRQSLDQKLIISAQVSAETIDEGQEVTGQLSISDTAEVLLYMVCPPKIERDSTSTSLDSRVVIVPPRQFHSTGIGHELSTARRERPHYLQSLLFRMIEHGPYLFPFRPMELLELFDEALDVFQSQKSLVHLPYCVIFGDLRGSYVDLHRWLKIVGWPPKTRLLFLGNTIDAEKSGSLEVMALISALKIAFPDDVFLLRGVTETLPFYPKDRFPKRTASAIGRCITRMCGFLPTSAIVLDRILAVPSGITPLVESVRDLAEQPRPTTADALTNVQRHLIFNQPSTSVRMYRKNKDSRGDLFGFNAVERIRADLNVNMIVRGGAPLPDGYCPCWEHSLVSLWSTPTGDTNTGAVLVVSKDLEVTPLKLSRQNLNVPFITL